MRHSVDRNLGSFRAAGVAAHAVYHDDESAFLLRYDFYSVLIFLSMSDMR
jgi:hypothetical protein